MAQQPGTESESSAPPGPKPRIFISCVSSEFRSARAKVTDVLHFLGYEVEKQEIFGTESGDLRQMLRDKIESCDGLIQIVGDGYGAEPTGPDEDYGRVSYTQFEFLHARDQGKKTWLLFAGPDAARDTPVSRLDLPEICPDPELPDAAAREYQAKRRALQTAYRDERHADEHLHWSFGNDTELELVTHKLRQELKEQRDQFQHWQRDLAGGQQQIQRRQKSNLALTLGVSAVILLLGAGGFFGLKHFGERNTRRIEEKQQVNTERIRAHLAEASRRALDADLADADAVEDDWQRRDTLRNAAEAAHTERLGRIDGLAQSFAELQGTAKATDNFNELTRIVAGQGVEEALAWLDGRRGSILDDVALDLATAREKLQPLLTGAQLAETEGRNSAAESLYRDILEADFTWADARHGLWEFLTYTSGPRAETHATLADSISIYEEAHRHARRLVEDDPSNAEWQHDLFVSHVRLGDVAVAQGDLDTAGAHYGEDLAIARKLSAGDPGNALWQRDLSASHDRLGYVAAAQGDLDSAATHFGDCLAIAEKLAVTDPGNTEWQRDLAVSHRQLGNVAMTQGDRDSAARHYRKGLSIAEKLAESDPENVKWQRDLSTSLINVGDVAVAGDPDTAASHYGEGLAIREKLAARDPGNAEWQRDLSVSHQKLGDLAVARDDLDTAATHYGKDLAIAKKLAARDPGNALWQRDLSLSHDRLGYVAAARGDLDTAATHFGDCLAIAIKLAASDPGNTEWQRDLSVGHENLGDVAREQGDRETASTHFAKSHAITEKLAASDPGNADWQRDLFVGHQKIGDVAREQGHRDTAAAHYRDGLTIAEKLAASDPGNTKWQRDLSVSHDKLGSVAIEQDDRETAVAHYRKGLAIAEKLAASAPDNSKWQRDLFVSHNKLGNVAKAQGNLDTAAVHYGESLAIAGKLAASAPGKTEWQRDLSVSQEKLGDVAMAQDDWDTAATRFGDALAIRVKLAASAPANAMRQRDLFVSYWKLADLAEMQENALRSREHLEAAYDALNGIRQRGGHVSPDDLEFLKSLEIKLGIGEKNEG